MVDSRLIPRAHAPRGTHVRTLRVESGLPPATLSQSLDLNYTEHRINALDAERPDVRTHAERGHEDLIALGAPR